MIPPMLGVAPRACLAAILALALVPGARSASPRSQAVEVRVQRSADARPLGGVVVHVDDSRAVTDPLGVARFPALDAAPRAVTVRDLDHQYIAREVRADELACGTVTLQLTPIVRVDIAVQVASAAGDAGDAGIAGAHIELVRLGDDHAPLTVEAWADWSGALVVRDLAAGEYAARCDAPGCAPWAATLRVSPDAGPVRIALEPLLGEGLVAGDVTDQDGRAVAGAEVALLSLSDDALAPLATTRSGADGAFAARGRFVGTRAIVRQGATSGPLVVRVRAAGHLDGYRSVHLDPRGTARAAVQLWPSDTRAFDREPNDVPATAQPAPPGCVFTVDVRAPGDADHARLPVVVDSLLRVAHPRPPRALWLRLYDRRGALVAERGFGADAPLAWDVPLRAGEHVLGVTGWGGAPADVGAVDLALTLRALVDPRERNDEPATASSLCPGATELAYLFPPRDIDVWRLAVDGPGTARLSVSPRSIAIWMRAHDDGGALLGERGAGAGVSGVLEVTVRRAGSVSFALSEWNAQPLCLEPIAAQVEWIPGDAGELGARDDSAAHARPIPASGLAAGTLNPAGDIDQRRIDVVESGVLEVRLSALPIATWARVRDAAGRVLGERGAGVDVPLELAVALERAGSYTVELEHWGRHEWSAMPYVLRTAFHPNDLRDRRANDTLAHASPISPTTLVVGQVGFADDRDLYRVHLPAAAHLRVTSQAHPLSRWLRLRGPEQRALAEGGVGAGAAGAVEGHVDSAGWVGVEVEQWGRAAWARDAYVMELDVALADPDEATDAPAGSGAGATPLAPGEARSATILPRGDRDRFALFVPRAGRQRAFVRRADFARWARLYDAADRLVVERGAGAGADLMLDWDAAAAGAYSLEVTGWGGTWSRDPYDVAYGPVDAPPPPRAHLTAHQARGAERRVTFTVAAEGAGPLVYELDRGDHGPAPQAAAWLVEPGEVTHVYADAGWFTARLRVTDARGAVGTASARFCTRESRDDRGLQVELRGPAAGAVVDGPFDVEVLAWSPDGAQVDGVRLELDERVVARWAVEPYRARLDPASCAGRTVTLRALARSLGGGEARAEAALRVAPLLDLAPEDGALLTSPEVLFTWTTAAAAPTEVVVTATDGRERRFTGADARAHAALAVDLERDQEYAWVARSGADTSAPRRFRLVRGLELSERRYTFGVERDYDQRGTLRVVNHGDAPAELVLHVASEHAELLVGFVGEGSPDKVVQLAPGEQRDVLLGISAQDAADARYTFPVTLEGRCGDEVHHDHALVDVNVRMPRVEFDVALGEPDPGTLGVPVTVTNRGERVTDLTVTVSPAAAAYLAPSIEHASFEPGEVKRFEVAPALSPSFSAVDVELVVRALHVEQRRSLRFALPEGKRVFLATVDVTQETAVDASYCTNRPKVQSTLRIAPGPFIGGDIGAAPLRTPLSASRSQADRAALHHRLSVWIGRRALNPKVEKVMRALLDAHLHQVDGVWVGSPVEALKELLGYLRETHYSELTRHERWLAETGGRSELRELLDVDFGATLVDLGALSSSSGSSGVGVYLDRYLPPAQAAEAAASFREAKIALEVVQRSSGRLVQVGELAARKAKLADALTRMQRGIEAVRASTGGDPAQRAELLSRLYTIQAKTQLAARKADQAASLLSQHVARIQAHVGSNKQWQAKSKLLTKVAFVMGFASRYEYHSRREGMSEATAVALALAQTAAYIGATTVPMVAAADLVLTGTGLAGDALGAEVEIFGVGTRAGDLGVDKLIDTLVDHTFYGAALALSDDAAAAAPVSMARLRHALERLDERIALADEPYRTRLQELRAGLQRLLTAKENDP